MPWSAGVGSPPPDPVRWSVAMERALYSEAGFYIAGEGAAGHFRTSASASASVRAIFAEAVGELLDRVDAALGRPDPVDLVDVGSGSADLLTDVVASIGSGLAARVRQTAIERRPAPGDLSAEVGWLGAVPELTGLLIANEWLDNVPIDVVVGGRVVLVDPTGAESPGGAPTAQESAWLARWWPTGHRQEIGTRRDIAWAEAVSQVRRGLAVAIDYTHSAADRPVYGTVTGFRRGQETEPIPDGGHDLTAHVAIDSVAAAGEKAASAGGQSVQTMLTDQRAALACLGVSGRRPDYSVDPGGYAVALQRAGEAAELIDPAGLGSFTWLLQGIDLDPTAILSRN